MKCMKISKDTKNALGFVNVMEITFINESAFLGPSKIYIHLISARNMERMGETAVKLRTARKVEYL